MNTYTIMKKPENLDWSKIPVADINLQLQKEPVDISATAQLCYDKEALYVRLAAKEKNIRAMNHKIMDAPCEDSCLEFFFSPIEGDNRYFNIELNPNCCLYLGMGSCINDLVRFFPEENKNILTPKATYTTDGWEITYQIPVSFIKLFFPEFVIESGKTMRGNFYKCGDLTEKLHYLCWNQVTSDPLTFHYPKDFGLLIFE